MSEQPSTIQYSEHRRSKPDGSLEMGPETDVLLHASDLPRQQTISAANAEAQTVSPAEHQPMPRSEVIRSNPETPAEASALLKKIVEARIGRMRPEDTPFMKEVA